MSGTLKTYNYRNYYKFTTKDRECCLCERPIPKGMHYIRVRQIFSTRTVRNVSVHAECCEWADAQEWDYVDWKIADPSVIRKYVHLPGDSVGD